MDLMGGMKVPDILPEIKQIDISNEEYQKIMNLFQPERSKREDYKVTTINSYECPKIEMKIDKDILTKYKWDSIDAVL